MVGCITYNIIVIRISQNENSRSWRNDVTLRSRCNWFIVPSHFTVALATEKCEYKIAILQFRVAKHRMPFYNQASKPKVEIESCRSGEARFRLQKSKFSAINQLYKVVSDGEYGRFYGQIFKISHDEILICNLAISKITKHTTGAHSEVVRRFKPLTYNGEFHPAHISSISFGIRPTNSVQLQIWRRVRHRGTLQLGYFIDQIL